MKHFGTKETPIIEVPFYKWLCSKWESGDDCRLDSELVKEYCQEHGIKQRPSWVNYIIKHFQFYAPKNKSYLPINLATKEGRCELVRLFRGMNGNYLTFASGVAWAKRDMIVSTSALCYVRNANGREFLFKSEIEKFIEKG